MLWMSGNFYKVVVQLVLLYGSETWIIMGTIMGSLEQIHWRVVWRIAGRIETFNRVMVPWSFLTTEEALTVAETLPLGGYPNKRQNGRVYYVATRPTLGVCLESVRLEVFQERCRWQQRGESNEKGVRDNKRSKGQ